MTCGLVHASYSLPKWQAVKTDFLCTLHVGRFSTRLPTINHFPVHYQLQTLFHECVNTDHTVCPGESYSSIPRQWNFTGWEMLKYHILNIIPHTFYRRTAIKLLNSVEQCFRNNFQTKKTWTEGLINFKKLFPLSNSCCHLKIIHIHFLIISYSKNISGSPGSKVPTVTVSL